ncbi:unnamed protein product, partial [marine sediment metagenome]
MSNPILQRMKQLQEVKEEYEELISLAAKFV